ncbi:MAG: hypothetical protein QGF46_04375 [Planctomycetota bacterium]|nr:hypothetical protein [Planctomycetota bacterium]
MRNLILSLVLLVIAGNLLASRSINNANEGIRYVNIDSCLTQWSEYNVVRDQLAEETRAVTAQLSEQAAAIQLKRDELELLVGRV